MSKSAPGRYCLAVCYCGDCAHYKPLVRHADTEATVTPIRKPKPRATSWDDREDETWIDKL